MDDWLLQNIWLISYISEKTLARSFWSLEFDHFGVWADRWHKSQNRNVHVGNKTDFKKTFNFEKDIWYLICLSSLTYLQMIGLGTFVVAQIFFGVFNMAVDTLFLSFCKSWWILRLSPFYFLYHFVVCYSDFMIPFRRLLVYFSLSMFIKTGLFVRNITEYKCISGVYWKRRQSVCYTRYNIQRVIMPFPVQK